MSFVFEIKLTPCQIRMLIFFVNAAMKKRTGKLPKGTSVSSLRALIADGFLQADKDPNLRNPTKWKVTRKGFMVCDLIREEMKMLKLPKPPTDTIYWYDMPPKSTHCIGVAGGRPRGKVVPVEAMQENQQGGE